jgi:hypothetical protein
MAKSKQLQESISLGKKLVRELSSHGHCDLTVRWMAHHIGQLIERAEKEKSPAQKKALEKECADTIVELWKHREYFPERARPLSNLHSVLHVLNGLAQNDKEIATWRRYQQFEEGTAWGDFIRSIRISMDNILELTILAAATRESMLKEKEWLNYPSHLSEPEILIIKRIDELLESEDDRVRIIIKMIDEPDEYEKKEIERKKLHKKDQIFNKLQDLINNQLEYLQELKNKVG